MDGDLLGTIKLNLDENGTVVKTRKKPVRKTKPEYDDELKGITLAAAKKMIMGQREKLLRFNNGASCILCDTYKDKSDFYVSTDPMNKSGVCPICKECARKLALRVDKNGEEHEPTKESVQLALKYLNKPYIEAVWNSSVQEYQSLISGRVKANVWNAYIRQIAMINYVGMTYFDSDIFKTPVIYDDEKTIENQVDNKDVREAYEQNKEDAIRLLGYDPFEKEAVVDQPFLYANLIGYLDASSEANEDRMRVSSIIEIVKGFNHIEKLNDIIAKLLADTTNMGQNISTVRALEATKTNITTSLLNLAKDNGISLKHSVNGSKGENTWTGRVRKMKEMNLRDAEMNLYDTEYSAGLRQVAESSNAAIIKQIRLDENDYNDMIIQQRELINKYKKIADDYEEKARILLRENTDLKSRIKELENGN